MTSEEFMAPEDRSPRWTELKGVGACLKCGYPVTSDVCRNCRWELKEATA